MMPERSNTLSKCSAHLGEPQKDKNTNQRTQTLRTKFPKCFYFTKTKNIIIIVSFKKGNIKND